MAAVQGREISASEIIWALGTCSALHGKPFDPQLLLQHLVPPYGPAALVQAARALGFNSRLLRVPVKSLGAHRGHVALLRDDDGPAFGLLLAADATSVTWIPGGSEQPQTESSASFASRYSGELVEVLRQPEAANDPDQQTGVRSFGFRWFVPELLKHRKVWRDVLGASLVLQLLALGLPLFTQAIIDKVVVHQTESTLV